MHNINVWSGLKFFKHKEESVQENKTYKILGDFLIETDPQIPGRRPDLPLINKNKRTCQLVDFAIQPDNKVTTKKAKR